MRAPPLPLADFRREPSKAFNYLTRREIDEIVGVVRDLAEQQDAMTDSAAAAAATGGAVGGAAATAAGEPASSDSE